MMKHPFPQPLGRAPYSWLEWGMKMRDDPPEVLSPIEKSVLDTLERSIVNTLKKVESPE